jgi:hypothetical protein
MPYNKFEKDLAQGKKYEVESLNYLDYDTYEMKEGYFKEYDLTIFKDGTPTKIEVKSDRQASTTGNMAIEYECKNKPSGLSATKADYWIYFVVHKDKDECYKIPTDELRELVKDCRKVRGGDNYMSRMYLLKIDNCKKYRIYRNN